MFSVLPLLVMWYEFEGNLYSLPVTLQVYILVKKTQDTKFTY